MEHIFSMQVWHPQSNIHHDLQNLFLRQLTILFVQVVKKTATWQKLSNHIILIVVDTHSHVKYDTWMEKFIDHLNLFNEMTNMFVSEPFLF